MSTPSLGPLHQVAQRAQDLDRSVAFYRDTLGLDFLARFDPPGLAFFDVGGTRLLLEPGASSATLYFRVDDVQAAYEQLRAAGVAFESEPHLIHVDEDGVFGPAGSQERMAFLRDPDDNLLAIASRSAVDTGAAAG